ncbi:type IV secretion system protein, partial [Achromobacter marplatensis]
VIFLCQILAIIAMVLMSIAFIVVLQMSYVMLQLGLALGPLLVGLSIIPAVSFLFDGWLRFMIAASLQQLVAWFVAVLITKGVVPTLVSFYDKIDSRKEADLYFASNEIAMIAIALLGFIAAYMMWQVPGLAQALVAGGSANAQSFGRGMVGRGMAAKILRSGGKR